MKTRKRSTSLIQRADKAEVRTYKTQSGAVYELRKVAEGVKPKGSRKKKAAAAPQAAKKKAGRKGKRKGSGAKRSAMSQQLGFFG
jgi:hypothetical protein